MTRELFAIALAMTVLCSAAQPSRVMDENVRTLQVTSNGNAFGMPVMGMGEDEFVDIHFDVLTHEYKRLVYHIEHCDAEWRPTRELFESEYLERSDGQTIEEYDKSINTDVLYTHYHLRLPNDEVKMRLSGNYRVKIIDEESDRMLAEACFMVVEGGATVNATVTSRTDKDINGRHQQLEMEIGYSGLGGQNGFGVVDPDRELSVVVIQNRRWDNRVVNPQYNVRSANSIRFTHRRDLVFDAGSECHKFEIQDKNNPSMGVERIEYHAPYEHAVLFACERGRSYTYEEDHNGAFVIRGRYGDEDDTRSEYMFVHFTLACDKLPGNQRVYVQGDFTHGQLLPECEMRYDEETGMYELGILLKQGYYEYRFVHTDNESNARTWLTEGDFYETRNEYAVLVYWRERGGRYDRLVGYTTIK